MCLSIHLYIRYINSGPTPDHTPKHAPSTGYPGRHNIRNRQTRSQVCGTAPFRPVAFVRRQRKQHPVDLHSKPRGRPHYGSSQVRRG